MLSIEFTDSDIKALHYQRFHHPHPRVRLKMEVLWLKSQGLPHKEITRLTCISSTTLRCYLKDYVSGGIEKLKQLTFARTQSELVAHRELIESYFREFPPTTIKEAAAKIEELTGIKRGQTQTRHFLASMGMHCLKVGVVQALADPDKQAEFKKKVRTQVRRSQSWQQSCIFCRCRPLCFRSIPGLCLVFHSPQSQISIRQTAIQCARSLKCCLP